MSNFRVLGPSRRGISVRAPLIIPHGKWDPQHRGRLSCHIGSNCCLSALNTVEWGTLASGGASGIGMGVICHKVGKNIGWTSKYRYQSWGVNENAGVDLFAMVTSQGASHKDGEELQVPKKYRTSLLPHLVSRQLFNCAPLITTCVHVLFTWCQSWGAQTQAEGCIFIRDISHQGSLLRVAHSFLLSRRPAKSHDLIRDKISSFVYVPRIWRDGAAGTWYLVPLFR